MRYRSLSVGTVAMLASLAICTPSEAQSFRQFTSASGISWSGHVFMDQRGTEQAYYISEGPPDAPVALLVQGSGCVPVFATIAGREHVATASQDVLSDAAGGARVMIVEKPGLSIGGEIGSTPGLSQGCSSQFRNRYSLDDWTSVLESALAEAEPHGPLVILGVSEGGTAAALLAKRGFTGPVGLVSAGACSAAGGLIERAYIREREGLPGTGVDETFRLLGEITANPSSIDHFAWGQTYRRWSTFGAACNARLLDQHTGPLFIAYGTADSGVDISAFEDLAEFRRNNGWPVLVHRIRGGDHDLTSGGLDHRSEAFRAFIDFALPTSPDL